MKRSVQYDEIIVTFVLLNDIMDEESVDREDWELAGTSPYK